MRLGLAWQQLHLIMQMPPLLLAMVVVAVVCSCLAPRQQQLLVAMVQQVALHQRHCTSGSAGKPQSA